MAAAIEDEEDTLAATKKRKITHELFLERDYHKDDDPLAPVRPGRNPCVGGRGTWP